MCRGVVTRAKRKFTQVDSLVSFEIDCEEITEEFGVECLTAPQVGLPARPAFPRNTLKVIEDSVEGEDHFGDAKLDDGEVEQTCGTSHISAGEEDEEIEEEIIGQGTVLPKGQSINQSSLLELDLKKGRASKSG